MSVNEIENVSEPALGSLDDPLSSGFVESIEQRYPISVLETLLKDRTTERNIIWADDEYEALGSGYMGDDEITIDRITGLRSGVIKPRIAKERERQSMRTRNRAEVFTPSWLCNQMNNHFDEEWFEKSGVFNVASGRSWISTKSEVEFPKEIGRDWKSYVTCRILEITCGEAPFVCSRYDTVTGELVPVQERIGFLDRKLRVVSEQARSYEEWVRWAFEALKSSFGYEYQGDNLVIARINVIETFVEHAKDRWDVYPSLTEIEQAAHIISWNFWQMDGLSGTVPLDKPISMDGVRSPESGLAEPEDVQLALFDIFDEKLEEGEDANKKIPLSVIYDWENDMPKTYVSLRGGKGMAMKKFYAVIGNPPYQEETESGSTRKQPIYNFFMDEAYKVGERVQLVTPARFLFKGGYTSKAWDEKMLRDPHLKVIEYESDSTEYFPGILLEGGVAITYRNADEKIGPIGVFVKYQELNGVLAKVLKSDFQPLADLISPPLTFQPSNKFAIDFPDFPSRFRSNAFDVMPEIFLKAPGVDGENYIEIQGLSSSKRVRRFAKKEYVSDKSAVLDKWKVLVPESNGASGTLSDEPARIISKPMVVGPGVGYMQTYIAVGRFSNRSEAEACHKYILSKFARVMLAILKVTQHNPGSKWIYVPTQDFSDKSDIDWSKSVSGIDRQLYEKYGLSGQEIEFIETHVKEMN